MRIRLRLDHLQQLLARSPLSQNHWAVRLGLSKGHLSNLLAGKHLYPSARTRERMLEVLGVPFEELFEVEPGQHLPDASMQQTLREQYLVDQEIGQGGMGAVYLARDLRLGRAVAIKIVSAEVVSGVGSRALLKEIVNTNRLQHPNILPILDAGEADGSPYYVMPYVRGGSLRELLRRDGRIPVGRVLALLSGVAAALDHAHAAGILHCDVKPANVLIADDHAWLIDFGIARVVQSEVWEGEWRAEYDAGAGTPAYVSPEQARGEKDLDARSDVYSLACMLYELLAGAPPFEGPTTLATVAKRFAGPPPELRLAAPHLPRELSDALLRAMATDRADRTATAGAFLQDCRHAVASAGSVVGVPAPLRAPAPPVPRQPLRSALAQLRQDIAFAWRGILRTPGIAVAICLTLGLGIGVNAVMFGMIDRLFLRPPAEVQAPDALRRIYLQTALPGREPITARMAYPQMNDLRGVASFAGAAGYLRAELSLDRGAAATMIPVMLATHDFFPLLGVQPQFGRFYGQAEDATGVGGTAVIGHAFWQRHFNGRADVLGTTLRLGKGRYTIIGVAPEGFNGLDLEAVDVFLPLLAAGQEVLPDFGNEPSGIPWWQTSRGGQWLQAVVRLRPGTTMAAATAEASTRLHTVEAGVPGTDSSMRVMGAPLLTARGPLAGQDVRVSLWLGGISLVLLLIAAANVVNLLLARLTHRESELALRAALGASRGVLVRQIVTETLCLTLLAGCTGLLLAQGAGTLIGRILLPAMAPTSALRDPRVILFTLGVALVTGLLAGLIPAWRGSSPHLAGSLRTGRGGGIRRSALQSGLLVAQAGLSVLLLVGAGLFVRSVQQIRAIDAGIDLDQVLLVRANFPAAGYDETRDVAAQREAMQSIARIPGVTGVTGSSAIPFMSSWVMAVAIPGIDSIPGIESGGPYINLVGADYFKTVGTRIVAGRGLEPGDAAGAPRVVVIGETMARRIWPESNPVGQCLHIASATNPCLTIVGIAQDAPRMTLLDRERVQYYVPLEQYSPNSSHDALFVRVAGDPARLIMPIRRALQTIAPELPVVDVRVLRDLTTSETRSWRLGATLFTLFGGLAMLVAVIGLYSLLSFAVARRTREFGIRTALGAEVGDVVGMVLRSGMRMVLLGLGLGLVAALVAGRWIAPLLYQTSPTDPLVFAAVTGVLLLAAAIACLIPARRAARVAPTEALRAE